MFLPLSMRTEICEIVDALRLMLQRIAERAGGDRDAAHAGLDELQRLENILCLSAARVVPTSLPRHRSVSGHARRDKRRRVTLAGLAGDERVVFEALLTAEEPLATPLLRARASLARSELDRALRGLRRKRLIVRWALTHGIGYTVSKDL